MLGSISEMHRMTGTFWIICSRWNCAINRKRILASAQEHGNIPVNSFRENQQKNNKKSAAQGIWEQQDECDSAVKTKSVVREEKEERENVKEWEWKRDEEGEKTGSVKEIKTGEGRKRKKRKRKRTKSEAKKETERVSVKEWKTENETTGRQREWVEERERQRKKEIGDEKETGEIDRESQCKIVEVRIRERE